MKKLIIGKTPYEIEEEVDMNKFPACRKYTQRELCLKGPRGAYYMLSQRNNGSWYTMSIGTIGHFCQPRSREVNPVFIAEGHEI